VLTQCAHRRAHQFRSTQARRLDKGQDEQHPCAGSVGRLRLQMGQQGRPGLGRERPAVQQGLAGIVAHTAVDQHPRIAGGQVAHIDHPAEEAAEHHHRLTSAGQAERPRKGAQPSPSTVLWRRDIQAGGRCSRKLM
jgi:hypothetical protein